jgi:hypothetical protein
MRVNRKFMNLMILTLRLVVNGWITPLYHFNTQQHHLGQEKSNQKSNKHMHRGHIAILPNFDLCPSTLPKWFENNTKPHLTLNGP